MWTKSVWQIRHSFKFIILSYRHITSLKYFLLSVGMLSVACDRPVYVVLLQLRSQRLNKIVKCCNNVSCRAFYVTPFNLKVLIKRFSPLSMAGDNFTFTTSEMTEVTYSWILQRCCVSNHLQFICIFHIIHSEHCELNYKFYQYQKIHSSIYCVF